MKKAILGLLLLSGLAYSNITQDEEFLLNRSGSVASKTQMGTLINKTPALLIARYSWALQGGSTANVISLVTDIKNAKSLAVIPASAIITNAWLHILEKPTSNGTATVSLQAKNPADLLNAVNVLTFPAAGGFYQGIPFGSSVATFVRMSSANQSIKLQVGTASLNAGRFDVYINYVRGNN